jgi:hypothetical protein
LITEALNIENSRGEKPERTLTVHWSGSKVCDERAWNPGKERYSVVKQLVGAFLCLLFVLYGDCTWEALCLPSCFFSDSNLRTAAPPHAWNRDWQLFLVVPKEQAMPYEIPSAETIGAATFADCGENKSHLKVFRVNAGVPLLEALEHASHVLYYAKMLSLEAAMDPKAEKFAFASHYLGEMGKAIIDDLLLAMQPGSPAT